jgi:membrane-bound serine protease (ClpP class)
MISTILIIVLLVLGGLVMIAAELMTPTFGLLAALAAGLLIWAVYLAFTLGAIPGFAATAGLAVIVPLYLRWAMRMLQNTKFGRKMSLWRGLDKPGSGTPEGQSLAGLVGRETVAETILRPSGAIRVDGRRIVAVAESGFIDKGRRVRILRASGTDVIVRAVEEGH